ncbi:hypothetical protein BDM02DRAFT_3189490 [Thelephora ganbajun]|uniref:Uncharacterized protein n=1 Tax=Thelephora ganbajun TaxID=370292 RepID=A0ACB6Z818_THEGA|nr:hypothetical protein BDM02DRAFT_3189490 [Thelephora ganbajun]
MRVWMLELELAWERMEFQASSSGYVSAGGEEAALAEEGMEEERIEEEDDMGEEGLWSPNSSDRAVLALVPDAPAFPVSYFPTINPTSLEPYINARLAIQATDSGIIFQLNWGTKQFNAFLCCLFPALFAYFDTIAPGFKTIPDELDNIGMKRIEYMLPYMLLEKEYRRYNIVDDMHPVATRYKEALSGDGSNAGFRAKAIFIGVRPL